LVAALVVSVPKKLAEDLVDEFIQIRQDVATGTLGRASPGKFVETLVQVLQHLESGTYESQPSVDAYLRGLENKTTTLDDGLRVCASRIGRAMYTLRNKRNILHKGTVDPNQYDLGFLHSAAQWVMAELIRQVTGSGMQQAGALVEQVQAPVGGLVEDFGGKRIVLHDFSTAEEILVLLHSHYPTALTRQELISSLDRRSRDTVRKAVQSLWREKQVEEVANGAYKLTKAGLREAIRLVKGAVE
jgi:hypothetical protein